jgi:hypothetical protein
MPYISVGQENSGNAISPVSCPGASSRPSSISASGFPLVWTMIRSLTLLLTWSTAADASSWRASAGRSPGTRSLGSA